MAWGQKMPGTAQIAGPAIELDGQWLAFQPGQTLLEVAREHGVDIPHLCYLEGLSPDGSCRLCLVEIEGQTRPAVACETLASPGMVVRSQTPALAQERRTLLEFLFAEHNHVCAICVSSGHCELQSLAQREGMDHVRMEYRYPRLSIDATHERFAFDPNRCIVCTRCVRVCAEIEGAHVWQVRRRGVEAMVQPGFSVWAEASDCTDCGKCVETCPTGAIFVKGSAVAEMRKHPELVRDLLERRGVEP